MACQEHRAGEWQSRDSCPPLLIPSPLSSPPFQPRPWETEYLEKSSKGKQELAFFQILQALLSYPKPSKELKIY